MEKGTVGMVVGLGLAGAALLLLGSWVVQGNEWFVYDFFASKYEQSRREAFEQSRAYNEGMVQELQNMHFEYVKADEAHQKALGDIILHRTADYDLEKLPPDLREFIQRLKQERNGAQP
jgi:hypothetical protein